MTRRKSELPRAVLLCAGLLLGAALLGMGQSRAGETPYCRMELPPGYALVQPEDGGPVSLTKDGAVTGGLRLLGGGGDRALEHDILWSSYRYGTGAYSRSGVVCQEGSGWSATLWTAATLGSVSCGWTGGGCSLWRRSSSWTGSQAWHKSRKASIRSVRMDATDCRKSGRAAFSRK